VAFSLVIIFFAYLSSSATLGPCPDVAHTRAIDASLGSNPGWPSIVPRYAGIQQMKGKADESLLFCEVIVYYHSLTPPVIASLLYSPLGETVTVALFLYHCLLLCNADGTVFAPTWEGLPVQIIPFYDTQCCTPCPLTFRPPIAVPRQGTEVGKGTPCGYWKNHPCDTKPPCRSMARHWAVLRPLCRVSGGSALQAKDWAVLRSRPSIPHLF